MKEINETVLQMILPAIVFLGVMAILAGGVIFGKIGKRMDVQGEDFSQMEDTRVVKELCERGEPTIRCDGKKLWGVGEILFIPAVFTAKDTEGGNIDITVADIINQDGASVMECYQEQTNQAVFSRRGIYTFSLTAMDGQRKICKEMISVLVDER